MLSMFENFVNYPYPVEPRSNVYVISDSAYKEYQQQQAERQVVCLQSQLNRYERMIEETKANILEIQTNAGLLPEGKEPVVTQS